MKERKQMEIRWYFHGLCHVLHGSHKQINDASLSLSLSLSLVKKQEKLRATNSSICVIFLINSIPILSTLIIISQMSTIHVTRE